MTDDLKAVERVPNPWPENSDYGKLWRQGYSAGRSDTIRRNTPALLRLAQEALRSTDKGQVR